MFGLSRLLRKTSASSQRRRRLHLEPLEDRCTPATLTYSSYFGGDVSDHIKSVATDAAGNIIVGGVLGDDTFPGPGPIGTAPITVVPAGVNGFVSELNPTGTAVIFTDFIETDLNGVTGIAVDASGNVYATGATARTSNFATAGAAQSAFGNVGNEDAFAMKLAGTTGAVVWATYIGNATVDTGNAIAVDSAGDAIVTGETTANGNGSFFPVKNPLPGQNALQSHAGTDAFVTEVNPTGSAFVYSTFLGGNVTNLGGNGSSDSHAYAVALDKAGDIYVTGYTEAEGTVVTPSYSATDGFPVTANAFETASGNAFSVFVTELQTPNPAQGSQLLYSTFVSTPTNTPLQDTGFDSGYGIALDNAGNILITGDTSSQDFPTKNAFQRVLDRDGAGSNANAFVTKLNPHNTGAAQLVYSTFDGGVSAGDGTAIAVDSAGDAYVAGDSGSDTYLGLWTPVNPFQRLQYPGSAFVAEFAPTGHVVFNSKYGNGGEAHAIAVSAFGNVIVAGDSTTATLNTTKANAYQPNYPGGTDHGFLAMLSGASVPKTFNGVDSDGDHYAVTLSGSGGINVIQDDPNHTGTGPIQTIYLQGTNSSSTLTISVTKKAGDGIVDVGSIVGTGLHQINAASANLTGAGIALTGPLSNLTIHDVANGADILAGDLPTQATTIRAHVIDDGTTISVGGIISLLQAASIGADTITAPRLTTLRVTGDTTLSISGDFAANLTLTGTGTALGTVTIAGPVTGADIQVEAGSVGSFRAAAFLNSALFLGQGSFAFGGAGGTLTANQRLGSFTITGTSAAFANSNVAAYMVGTVTLASVQTSNNGTAFGIEAQKSIAQVHVKSPAFTYSPHGPTLQSDGDFDVELT